MKKDMIKKLFVFCSLLLTALLLWGCVPKPVPYEPVFTLPPTTVETEPSVPTQPTVEDTTAPAPQPEEFVLSFAGDCTLGTGVEVYGGSWTFVGMVGDDYDYPFVNARELFSQDDFTMVNFEGVLCGELPPVEKEFRFRGPVEYAKILTSGDIEAVNLTNNHVYDFGQAGYDSTKKALDAEGILYVEDDCSALYTTERGLTIGIFATKFVADVKLIKSEVEKLRAEGAEVVIVSYHGGIESTYTPTKDQVTYAHAAIDAGANIFFGHHPHVLQPIEAYNGGIIYYSLGNFSFGGNRNPADKDTAVIQQHVIREPDGTIRLSTVSMIPYCVSSSTTRNTYQPTPYEKGTEAYERTLKKLMGTFQTKAPAQTPQPTQPTQPKDTTPATVPETTPATVPETTPATVPETTPATVPETTAATTPETAPQTTDGLS